jgi:hypothetical protein
MLGFDALGRLALGQLPGSATNTVLVAATGAFALTGTAVGFRTALPTASGAYTLTGVAASFVGKLTAATGAYAEGGTASPLAVNLATAAGAYGLTGNAAALTPAIAAGAGAFVATGVAAAFTTTFSESAAAYTIAWQAFSDVDALAARTGGFALTGNTAQLSVDIDLGGIGGRIAGGTFSRGQWREIKDAEHRRNVKPRSRRRVPPRTWPTRSGRSGRRPSTRWQPWPVRSACPRHCVAVMRLGRPPGSPMRGCWLRKGSKMRKKRQWCTCCSPPERPRARFVAA